MHVAEAVRRRCTCLLTEAEHLGGAQGVLDGGVQLVVDLADHAAPSPPTAPDLDLEDLLGLAGAGEQLVGDLQVALDVVEGQPSHTAPVEQRVLAAGHALFGDRDERTQKAVQLASGQWSVWRPMLIG